MNGDISMADTKLRKILTLGLSIAVISISMVFMLIDVVADYFYMDISTSWIDHSNIEAAIVIALVMALIVIGKIFYDLLHEHIRAQEAVKTASGQLLTVIKTKCKEWKLTASEHEVALLLIKGFSIQEIADLRTTKPGTIKSQSNAIYRKAGVSGRNELVAYFVEDLLAGEDLFAPSQSTG